MIRPGIRRLFRLPLRGRDIEEAELEEEIKLHLELRTEYLERQGLSPAEARAEAMRRFGPVDEARHTLREATRRREGRLRGREWLTGLRQDLRYTVRTLLKSPGFTAVVVLTLGLGIGATTAIFSVVDTVLLEPLPYREPDRAVMIWSSWKDFPQTWVSYDEFEAYRDEVRAFEEVGLSFSPVSATFGGVGDPEQVQAASVTRNLFRILGMQPVLGRTFTAEEHTLVGEVVILGHELWQRRFAGDPAVVGRTVEVNGTDRLVVGVMPQGFRMPLDYGADEPTEAWFPLALEEPERFDAVAGPAFGFAGGAHTFYGFARLAPGATVERANAELRALTSRLNAEGVYPADWEFRANAVSLPEQVTGRIRPALLVLLGAVALVLLIACANVAGLLLVRSERRRREFGVRAALGAGRRRLARQLLTESALLSLAGGAFGVALAWLGVALARATAPTSLPRVSSATLDSGVLGFALLASFATAALMGMIPAIHAAGVDPATTLKDGGRGTTGGAWLRGRHMLVVAEIALAVVLVIGAGLMVRSVRNLLAIDPGFSGEDVLTMQLSTPAGNYPDRADVAAFYAELERRLGELPGVEAAGAVRILPLATEIGDMGIHVAGYAPAPGENTSAEWQVMTPGYFEAMGTPLIAGRYPDARDQMDAPLVLVVNRSFAETYFAERDPIGRQVVIGGDPFTVVGVAEDIKHNALTAEVKPRFYRLDAQFAQRTMSLVVRAEGDAAALVRPVRSVIRNLDPRLAVSEARLMEDIVAESMAQPRFTMLLLAIFAGLALLLSTIGIYGVVAYTVSQRTQEIGIRMALGAHASDVLRLVVRQGVGLAALGVGFGIAVSLAATRVLSSLLYGVSTVDVGTFVAAPLLLAAITLIACYLPARRATRIDPLAALRIE